MTIRFLPIVSALCVVSGATLLTASCSLLAYRDAQHALPVRPQHQMHARRIAQLDFGRNASYGICMEPACPSITRKTLASRTPAQAPAAQPVMLAAASNSVARPSPVTGPAAVTDRSPRTERLLLAFSSGASRLDASARQALDKVLPAARKAEKILIMGRTDNVGSTKANHAIALARALQVRDYLRSHMKDVDNVIVIDAKGSCCFLSTNDTPHGRQANRRVEVVFTFQG